MLFPVDLADPDIAVQGDHRIAVDDEDVFLAGKAQCRAQAVGVTETGIIEEAHHSHQIPIRCWLPLEEA